MKPLVPALSVALSATLLRLGSAAGTDAGVTVTDTYQGFVKREFPRDSMVACTIIKNFESFDEAENVLQDFANGQNDQGKNITLGTPTLALVMKRYDMGFYCRYIPEDSAGTRLNSESARMQRASSISFYVKKVSDATAATVKAAAAEVMAAAQNEPEPQQYADDYVTVVEMTADNEVYAGVNGRPTS